MSTMPPPPLPPTMRPKPPGLSASQKTLVALAIVITLALTGVSIWFISWTQRASTDKSTQFGVLEEAKQRQAKRFAEYKDALAGLPEGTLPSNWSTESTLRAFGNDDLTLVHTLSEVFFSGGNQFLPLDLVNISRSLDTDAPPSPFAVSIQPREHTPEDIEKNLLEFLRGSKEITEFCAAIRNGIYYVDIDPAVATWEQDFGEEGVPPRHGPLNLLPLRALLEARWGTVESATEAYLDAVRFGELYGKEPFLSWHLSRYELEWRSDNALWEMVGQWDLSEETIGHLQEALAWRIDTTRLKELIVEEAELEFPRTVDSGDANNPFVGKMAQIMGLYDPVKTHKAAVKLASYVDRPFADMKKFVEQVRDRGEDFATHLGRTPNMALRARREQLRTTLTADVLKLVLALKRYKAEIGSYPATLDELDPTESVPVDPITGKAIEYLRWGDGYFLFAPSNTDDDFPSYDYDDYYDSSESEIAYGMGYSRDTLWHAKR